MPFFEGSSDVTVYGGKFTDVKGNWDVRDNSQHVHHINSHNTDTTNVIDSNNDSSVRNYTEMDVQHESYPTINDPRNIQTRNRQKERSAMDEAAIMKRIEQALVRGRIPLPQSSLRDSAASETALRSIAAAKTPIPSHRTRHTLPRRETDPFPIPASFNSHTSPYKSNNPFGHLMKTDPQLFWRSSSPGSQRTDDMDVDSDDK